MSKFSSEEHSRLSSALNDIDIRIHSNLGSAAILQSALDGFVEALKADAGDIKILEGAEWVVKYQVGFSPDVVGTHLTPLEAPVAQEVAESRNPILVPDYLGQKSIPYVGFPLQHNLRSTMAVPLSSRGEVIGCLFAWMRSGPRQFSEGELRFALRMAASVSLALDNSRLLEAEQNARIRAEQAEARLKNELEVTKILLDASERLSSTTEPDDLLEHLAQVVLEATQLSRIFVNLIDCEKRVLIPKVASSGLIAPQGDSIPFSMLSETALKAITDKRTTVLDYEHPDIPQYDRDVACANGAKVVLFIPLVHQSQVIGHIAVDEPEQRYDFSDRQIRVADSIAAQASVALQNARQYEREHRIAETLQQALLSPPEEVIGVDVGVVYKAASNAASVGGDYYDVFGLDDRRIALLIGDVAGKGIGAAPLTALMRDGARAYLLEDPDPAICFEKLNSLAYRFTPVDKFATAFIGVLDRSTGELRYCSAAHPHPVVLNGSGTQVLECPPAALLGGFPEAHFKTCVKVLAPRDVLVMVTDGVTEARRGDHLFGEDGLIDAVTRLRGTAVADMPGKLLSTVVEYAGGELRDDVVVLCVSVPDYDS